jgi:hypothetical protein
MSFLNPLLGVIDNNAKVTWLGAIVYGAELPTTLNLSCCVGVYMAEVGAIDHEAERRTMRATEWYIHLWGYGMNETWVQEKKRV